MNTNNRTKNAAMQTELQNRYGKQEFLLPIGAESFSRRHGRAVKAAALAKVTNKQDPAQSGNALDHERGRMKV